MWSRNWKFELIPDIKQITPNIGSLKQQSLCRLATWAGFALAYCSEWTVRLRLHHLRSPHSYDWCLVGCEPSSLGYFADVFSSELLHLSHTVKVGFPSAKKGHGQYASTFQVLFIPYLLTFCWPKANHIAKPRFKD